MKLRSILPAFGWLLAACVSENAGSTDADGSVDGTHFQENGARIMAGFVFDGIAEAGLGLGALTP